MNNPYITITSKGEGLADVEGIVDCDDAILFCRTAADLMATPMAYEMRQRFLSEMFVSILRKTCSFKEALEVISCTGELLAKNHETIGTPKDA